MGNTMKLWEISRIMRKEKEKKQCDNFVIIYGLWRSGKSNLGMRLIQHDGLISKHGYRKTLTGLSMHHELSKNWWANIFNNHYANTAGEMEAKIKVMPHGSTICVDEGADVASWHLQNTQEQSDMIRLLQKTGKLGHTTIFITPSRSLLTKNILQRAKWMFIIPFEHDGKGNHAYLYRNYSDPARAEKNPFDLNYLFDKVEKYKKMPTERIYTISNRFTGTTYFRWIHPEIYDQYEKIVKDPHMFQTVRKRAVPYRTHAQVKYALMSILSNLRTMDDKTYVMMRKLSTTRFGEVLLKEPKIKDLIAEYEGLKETPIPRRKT